MAVAQPLQSARAADALAGGVKPQRQQQPRRNRRMAGPVAAGLDPILKLAQIEPRHIGPDHPHRMALSDQALDIHRPQFDLGALGLAQARGSVPRRIGLRLRLLRQSFKQLVAGHHLLPRLGCGRRATAAMVGDQERWHSEPPLSKEVSGKRIA